MKNKMKTIITTLILICALLMTMNTVSADATWEVRVYPVSQDVQTGSNVIFQLNATPLGGAIGVGGWQIKELNYTTAYLDLNSVTEGNFLTGLGSTLFNDGTDNDGTGQITNIYCAVLNADNTTSAGILCYLNFSAEAAGTAEITFWGKFSWGETEIEFTAYGGNITIRDNSEPEITDNSPASGTTGDSYTFNVSISDDNDELSDLTVKVNWSHGENGANDSMVLSGSYFTKTVTLDHSISDITYHIYANDTEPLSNYTSELSATVSDNDLPTLSTITVSSPFSSAGKKFTIDYSNISVLVGDNIEVDLVYLDISVVGNTSITANNTGTTYYRNDTITQTRGVYTLQVWAGDTSENGNVSTQSSLTVYEKWDLNQDNEVDIVDITSVTAQFAETGTNRWIKQDISVNGEVDIVDVTSVTAHFGETY